MRKLTTLSILTLFLFFNKSFFAYSANMPLNKNSTSIQVNFKYKELSNFINKAYENNSSSEDTTNNTSIADNNDSNDTDCSSSNEDVITVKAILNVETTAYTGGYLTYTETVPSRDPNGLSTIAVDPSTIPLGSLVYVDNYGLAVASDTGGLIKGNKVDLYLNSEEECINYGVQNTNLYVLAYPGEW